MATFSCHAPIVYQFAGTFVSFVGDLVYARKPAENKHSFCGEGVFDLASIGGGG